MVTKFLYINNLVSFQTMETEQGILSDHGSIQSDDYVPDDVYYNQNHQSYEPVLQEAKRRGVSLQALHAIMNVMLLVDNMKLH